jgi:hypothetical protein
MKNGAQQKANIIRMVTINLVAFIAVLRACSLALLLRDAIENLERLHSLHPVIV